jgi:TonB family protein
MWSHPGNTLLSSYYDGETSAATADDIDRHLAQCELCRSEYRKMSGLLNAVRHIPARRAPLNLVSSVRERVDAEERGMVPVLRGQIQRTGNDSGLFPALSLGTLATVALLGLIVLLDFHYGERAARKLSSALIPMSLPEPVLLHAPMSSPRFRGGSVNAFPYADVERGKEGTMLALASLDQNGTVRALEVIYRSGDEAMLSRTLEAVRDTGFEPARLGNRSVPVNFLYFFTTTEVRAARDNLSTQGFQPVVVSAPLVV